MITQKPPTRRISLLLILLAASFTWLVSNPDLTDAPPPATHQQSTKPSSFVENAIIQSFEGISPSTLTVRSARAEFYQDRKEVTFIRPDITVVTDEQPSRTYLLSALSGAYLQSDDVIQLKGEVYLRETTATGESQQKDILELRTERLDYQINDNFITTTEAVKISRDQTTLSAIGMSINIDTRKLRLHSKVRGTHAFDS